MKREITFDRFARSLCVIILLVFIYLLLRKLSSVLIPFFVAWLIAYLLYPIVCFFQYKCRLKYRIVAICVTLVLLVGIIYLAGSLIIPPMLEEYSRLQTVITNYVSAKSAGSDIQGWIEEHLSPYLDKETLASMFTFSDITSFLEERVPQLFSLLSGSIKAIVGFVASLLAIIYMFFILMDYEAMSKGLMNLIPKKHRPFVTGMLSDVEQGMNGYFRGQSVIALCVGIMFAIGFAIIDFPLAIPLGLFIGFLNLVPYLQTIGFIPTIMLALLKSFETGQSFWSIFLAALVVFAVVQAIQDWILTPRIMGHVMGLNGAVILLSLSVWGTLLGLIGLIIALPLTTLIFSYYKRYVLKEQEEEEGQLEVGS